MSLKLGLVRHSLGLSQLPNLEKEVTSKGTGTRLRGSSVALISESRKVGA